MQLRAIIQTFLTVCDCFLRALYWLYPTKEHILPKIVTSVVFLSATHHIFRSHVQSLEEKCASVKYEKKGQNNICITNKRRATSYTHLPFATTII